MLYNVKIYWEKNSVEKFTDNKYSRAHKWIFDCGIELPASSSKHIVPLPMSDESAVDPEEAFVASLSSCHMLWFLSIAAKKKYIVENYEDNAEGILEKDGGGKLAMTKVTLKPKVNFNVNVLAKNQLEEIHHLAHEQCFISNSVKTEIIIIPQ